jgi:hypothetical protein
MKFCVETAPACFFYEKGFRLFSLGPCFLSVWFFFPFSGGVHGARYINRRSREQEKWEGNDAVQNRSNLTLFKNYLHDFRALETATAAATYFPRNRGRLWGDTATGRGYVAASPNNQRSSSSRWSKRAARSQAYTGH